MATTTAAMSIRVPPRNADTMVNFVLQYLREPQWRDTVGRECRVFTERHLAWPLIARQHLDFYRTLPN